MKIEKVITPITVYALVFLFTLHLTPAIYINSSFLETFVSNSTVGLIYTIASAITALMFFVTRPILNKVGNKKFFIVALALELVALITLALAPSKELVIGAFIVSFTTTALCFFNLDIFLESISKDSETGSIRGIYLTSLNSAFIIGPLISGFLIKGDAFNRIYILGAILLLPVLYMTIHYLKPFKDPKYTRPEFWKTSLKIWKNINLHNIFSCAFLMRFFFSWMVIYTPIYLHQVIGFDLSTTSLIISIGLLPFVLLEGILGKLADTKFGEKEILSIGFVITSLATLSISFISTPNVAVWMGILFMTRVGASMIEVMTETYLFKKIDAKDINTMSIYRTVRPIAYVVGPLTAAILLQFIGFKFIFVVLALVLISGLRYSLRIKDTL